MEQSGKDDKAGFGSEVVDDEGLVLTGHDKAILKEMVDVLELFEEATDILQGDYVSISFAIPCYFSLLKHLSSSGVWNCKGGTFATVFTTLGVFLARKTLKDE